MLVWEWESIVNYVYRIPWMDIGIAIGIFLIFLVFRKIFTRYIFKLIIRLSKKTPTEIFTNVLLAFEKPLRFIFVIIGFYLALVYLPLSHGTMELINQIYRMLIVASIGWGLYNFAAENSSLFVNIAEKLDLEENSMLIPFLSKVSRFIIIALVVSIIAGEWGFEVGGFVAGLGLGGLAFALAAQDTIGNFFGGIIIVTEKPFSKGDWIQTPSVEGTVEDITFRSTKVRTFAQGVVTVPNSTLANEAITNWTQMEKRRITFNLGVLYSTPKEKLENVIKRIEQTLQEHDGIDKDIIFVRFNEYNSSSLDIYLYFFTKTTVWAEWLKIKEEINFKILEILEDEGVSVAYPSRSLYFETPLEKQMFHEQMSKNKEIE
ncbi:mechanosensitive ion channel family protein [Bacillus sp. FJAT-45350]|uniref:mechanosensitive ion channel family protein n=1 Tax=Bacillus sp. FJAT-45350 TaxID=2011014 RepID=UPI00211BB947|nr:mechanosensitive ion channel family protein [Bacillus sp. FJAT-45350]